MAPKLPEYLSKVLPGRMSVDFKPKLSKKRASPSSGYSTWGFGLARVKIVNYEEFTVTLQVVSGEDNLFQHVPVPIGMSGAGARHISGSMPMVGDHCFVGWMAQESSGGNRTPVIINWVVPGAWPGHDWLPTQPFTPDEFGFTHADNAFTGNAYQRERHKLRHYRPGNEFASSAQGADFLLNEGVLLSDRRGDELRLRDQDQALVVRSLQQFHAMAGVRVYGGMVQRDATFLPTQMFSDGFDWAGPRQSANRNPVPEWELGPMMGFPAGFLTPDLSMQRLPLGTTQTGVSGASLTDPLDPFKFLQRGLFVDAKGYADGLTLGDTVLQKAVYGGKTIYRVSLPDSTNRPDNAVTEFQKPALTEYRIEVAHTADGKLPVTEQTDGFDAERLPDASGKSANAPFIEMVWGSVVGNDPYTAMGRLQYAIPLKPVIVNEAGQTEPDMRIALGSELKDYAATLFRLRPPMPDPPKTTFWSTTMDGRFKAFIGGSPDDFSVDAALEGGLRLRVGGRVELGFDGGFNLSTRSGSPSNNNVGLGLSSQTGAVHVYGGGEMTGDSVILGKGSGVAAYSLIMEGRLNALVKASRQVQIQSADITLGSDTQKLSAKSNISIEAGDRIGLTAKTLDLSTSGKCSMSFGGPKDQLPPNGPLRDTTFTTLIPNPEAVVDKYFVLAGSREEKFIAGSHSTTILVGNLSFATLAGEWKATAGLNSLAVETASGLKANVQLGDVLLQALVGDATLKGLKSVTVKSVGNATVSGGTGLYLGGPGKVGGIVSGADLDPLTGALLSSYFMGSPGHQLTAPS